VDDHGITAFLLRDGRNGKRLFELSSFEHRPAAKNTSISLKMSYQECDSGIPASEFPAAKTTSRERKTNGVDAKLAAGATILGRIVCTIPVGRADHH
jgi:hypothetical protein